MSKEKQETINFLLFYNDLIQKSAVAKILCWNIPKF